MLRVFYVVLFPLMLRGFVKAATHRPITQLDPNHNVGWIITTFSANILALEVVRKSIDAEPHALPKLIGSVFGWKGSQIAGVPIGPLEISVIGAALLMALLLETFLDKTTVGRAFRAVAQDKQTASLMGINPAVMVALSFAIAGALATVAVFTIGGQRNISLTDGTTIYSVGHQLGLGDALEAPPQLRAIDGRTGETRWITKLGTERAGILSGYIIALRGGSVVVATKSQLFSVPVATGG